MILIIRLFPLTLWIIVCLLVTVISTPSTPTGQPTGQPTFVPTKLPSTHAPTFTSATRIRPTIAEYAFYRSNCLEGFVEDVSDFHILGNLTTSKSLCLLSNGIASGVTSSSNIKHLKKLMGSTNTTYELWLQFNQSIIDTDDELLIMSVANLEETSEFCDFNFKISQEYMGNGSIGLHVTHCTEDGAEIKLKTAKVMQITNSSTEEFSVIHHVVVEIRYSSFRYRVSGGRYVTLHQVMANFTVNGKHDSLTGYDTAVTSDGSFNPSSWKDEFHLNFLGGYTPTHTRVSYARVFYGAIYNKILSWNERLINFESSIPNSLPVVISSQATVQEDGEIGDHFSDPFYYQTPIANKDLPLLAMDLYDLDDQTVSPNYRGILAYVEIVHASLPATSLCEFYSFEGTAIDASSSSTVKVYWNDTLRAYPVRVRPGSGLYSKPATEALCAIEFIAIDGITGLPSAESATVSVVVTHVDHPPVPDTTLFSDSLARKLYTFVVSGTDRDSNITSAWITSLPKRGELFGIFANGSIIYPAIDLPGGACSIYTSTACGYQIKTAPFHIAYKYIGNESFESSYRFWNETFSFVLQDIEGRKSIPANYSVAVSTALEALGDGPSGPGSHNSPFTVPLALENEISEIKLYGRDLSDTPREMTAQIVSLPQKGTLYFAETIDNVTSYTEAAVGMIVPQELQQLPNSRYSETSVYYLGQANYFSYPSLMYNGSTISSKLVGPDSFTFRIRSKAGAVSDVQTQIVTVRNVNQPTDISYSGDQKIKIYAVSDTEGKALDSQVSITGFEVVDLDLGVGVVTVHLTTALGGVVTLNEDYIALLDFNSIKYCNSLSRWKCKGDGYYDEKMIFVGSPAIVQKALNGMVYESPVRDIHDSINVTIYDGAGGTCLDDDQQGTQSSRLSCFSSSTGLHVTVIGFVDPSQASASTGAFANNNFRIAITVLGLLFVTTIAIFRFAKYRLGISFAWLPWEEADEAETEPLTANMNSNNPIVQHQYEDSVAAPTPTITPAITKKESRKASLAVSYDDAYEDQYSDNNQIELSTFRDSNEGVYNNNDVESERPRSTSPPRIVSFVSPRNPLHRSNTPPPPPKS